MSERDNKLLVKDMLEAARKIRKYTSGMSFQDFLDDDKTIDAVVRNFEIIGEAAGRIHPDYRTENPEIEWRQISGLRNRLIHAYFGVDHEILWTIIEDDVNELIDQLEQLLYN